MLAYLCMQVCVSSVPVTREVALFSDDTVHILEKRITVSR